jgi:uncharacterized protein YgiM (DUF1202 family)
MRPKILKIILVTLLLVAGALPLTSYAMRGLSWMIFNKSPETEAAILGCPIPAAQEIYAVPGDPNTVIDWLLQGTCVVFDARTQDNAWVRISAQEQQVSHAGWVEASYVVLTPGWDNLTSVAYTPVKTGFKACVIQADSLNIRNGPGTKYFEIGHLLEGDCISITGRNAENSWAVFEKGWLSTRYLQVSGDLHLLPVVADPPPDYPKSKWDK